MTAAVAFGVAACAPMVDTRGNLPSAERLSKITPGVQTRDEIAGLLGTPSNTSPFGEEVWYYVSSRTETVAFFAPKEVERTVVAVHFDDRGVVREVRSYGLAEGQPVDPVDRVTPTAGNEMNVLQQILGNVGRFSKDAPGGRTPGGL